MESANSAISFCPIPIGLDKFGFLIIIKDKTSSGKRLYLYVLCMECNVELQVYA